MTSKAEMDENGWGWYAAFPAYQEQGQYLEHRNTHRTFFMPHISQGDLGFGVTLCGVEFKIEAEKGHEIAMVSTETEIVDCIVCLTVGRSMTPQKMHKHIQRAHDIRATRRQLTTWVTKEQLATMPNAERVYRDENDKIIRPTGEQK